MYNNVIFVSVDGIKEFPEMHPIWVDEFNEEKYKNLFKKYYSEPAIWGQATPIANSDTNSHDVVNNPSHYNKNGIECIEAIEASMTQEQFQGYLKGNIIKYLWRYEYKNKQEDLDKAQWYMNKLNSNYKITYARETQTK